MIDRVDREARVQEIRSKLKRSWRPFFSSFGSLTDVQIQAIPSVLEGQNVIVAAPTASGKTEAVVAPTAELLTSNRSGDISIIYVVPTRALANDAFVRVGGPLADLGIKAGVKHGDRSQLSRDLPAFVITTPESLDSLICRQPRALGSLRSVILDEIHVLDNSYRGDQLRILLQRLRQLSSLGSFSTHLLSATLANPLETASRYVDRSQLIQVPGQRSIDYVIVDSAEAVYKLARAKACRKLLVFCNLRESVEVFAKQLSELWQPYPVFAHHGDLSRDGREEAEQGMREAAVAVCVATSTLEIGIDIGNIDLVVLAETPWSLSSLVQRIGRGNRRTPRVFAAAIATSDAERTILGSMFQAASEGYLSPQIYEADPSVAVQQVFSYLYQHPQGTRPSELCELLAPLCPASKVMLILTSLREKGWVNQHGGICSASTALMDKGEMGRIHSNIPDSNQYKVVDSDSGREIGKIAGTFDKVFVLNRRAWEVVTVSQRVIKVRRHKGKAPAPLFQRHRSQGAFSYLLPPEIRQEVARRSF